jgi:Mg-chelatase subunit ChlI
MTLRLLLSLSLLLAWQKVCAQLAPADDFFNGGAQLYISNNIPAALERVEGGLKIYPDDVKLKKLEQLLKQQQQQQQQQNQQQKQDQQKKQQNQQQNQQPSKDNSKDQQKKDEQKQNQADQKKDDQQKQQEQQKQSADKKNSEKQDKQEAEGQPMKAGQMTPQEATNRLDTLKNSEQILQLKPPEKPRNALRPIKDW